MPTDANLGAGDRQRRSVLMFNRTLATDLALRPNFLPGGDSTDLHVCVNIPGRANNAPSTAGDEGGHELRFSHPTRMGFVLHRNTIVCEPYSATGIDLEIAFLGQVMAVWMELTGALIFHAGAVLLNGRAVAFMGRNGAGKSTLTSLLVGAGAALITDDVLAVEKDSKGYKAIPSYPSMRMWPGTAAMVGLDHEPLIRVLPSLEKRYVPVGTGTFGSFHSQSASLARLYVLGERCGGSRARIEPMDIGPALFELARHSFAGPRLHVMGRTAQRFDALAALAGSVPLRRLSVPEGGGRVLEAIRADLASDCGK